MDNYIYPPWKIAKGLDPFLYTDGTFYEHMYQTYDEDIDNAGHPKWLAGWGGLYAPSKIDGRPCYEAVQKKVMIDGKIWHKSVLQVMIENYIFTQARQDKFHPDPGFKDITIFEHDEKYVFFRIKGKPKMVDPSYPYRYYMSMVEIDRYPI